MKDLSFVNFNIKWLSRKIKQYDATKVVLGKDMVFDKIICHLNERANERDESTVDESVCEKVVVRDLQ